LQKQIELGVVAMRAMLKYFLLPCLALASCQSSKPFVAPAPHQYDGRYVGTRRTVYPKCSADLDALTMLVKDNQVTVPVGASTDRIPVDADGSFSGNASTMAASGKIVGGHLSMELVGTECFYRMELNKR
jgi:hypothetical protein